jgi:hypothetical protein
MRERILRQGVSSAGTRQWTSTATGEVKSSIQYQVETTGSDPTVHLTYSLVKSGEHQSGLPRADWIARSLLPAPPQMP